MCIDFLYTIGMKKILTLCLVHQDNQLLLGLKKRGFGAGRWNGFGGKVESGESIEEAAKREMREETGVDIQTIQPCGRLHFIFTNGLDTLEIHVFRITHFNGEPIETEEMKPRWFSVNQIPYTQMWADDKYWLPLFLAGKSFIGKFVFADTEKLLEHEVHERLE